MDKKVKKKWLKALRSGKYKQTTDVLRDDYGYCCLGVLSHIAYKEGACARDKSDENEVGKFVYGKNREEVTLPGEVMKWAGLTDPNPDVIHEEIERSLVGLNDTVGLSFNQIADIIEEQL